MESDLLEKAIALLKENTSVERDTVLSINTKISEININSLEFVRFIVCLEQVFDIELDDSSLDFQSYETIGDLLSMIKKHLPCNS